ncbi:hypothetical protein NLI96_g1522 [Meripilus lineatus]|uniref:Uncharacterized protein n=1 Tax=Meripilus lineatus TaxID=2056292 RepID=A0AAD5YMR6_9APHY|nr:hypothetical protein NLI96_g1522 [Physisporinus lineatus]
MSTSQQESNDFFSNILTPGSSLHPTFLLLLDVAFGSLFLVFIGLAVLTKGSLHILALMVILGALWASVKWFVHELQKVPASSPAQEASNSGKEKEE